MTLQDPSNEYALVISTNYIPSVFPLYPISQLTIDEIWVFEHCSFDGGFSWTIIF